MTQLLLLMHDFVKAPRHQPEEEGVDKEACYEIKPDARLACLQSPVQFGGPEGGHEAESELPVAGDEVGDEGQQHEGAAGFHEGKALYFVFGDNNEEEGVQGGERGGEDGR